MEIFTLIFLQLSSSLSEALKDMTNHVIIGTLIQLVKNSSMPYPAEELHIKWYKTSVVVALTDLVTPLFVAETSTNISGLSEEAGEANAPPAGFRRMISRSDRGVLQRSLWRSA